MRVSLLLLITPVIASSLIPLDGTKLKNLINCFAWYLPDAAYRADNSQYTNCDEKSILFCKTDSGHNDHFCQFTGTNLLIDYYDTPECYYNCQMETCNAWSSPTNQKQEDCVAELYKR